MNTSRVGGSAFPLAPGYPGAPSEDGMSLRDYFAGQALVGLLMHYHEDDGISPEPLRTLAALSYEYADHMLARRDK